MTSSDSLSPAILDRAIIVKVELVCPVDFIPSLIRAGSAKRVQISVAVKINEIFCSL